MALFMTGNISGDRYTMTFDSEKEALDYLEELIVDVICNNHEKPEDITEGEVKTIISNNEWCELHEIVPIELDIKSIVKRARETLKEWKDNEKKKKEKEDYEKYLALKERFGD